MKKTIVSMACATLLIGCVAQPTVQSAHDEPPLSAKDKLRAEMFAARKVNENWSVDCVAVSPVVNYRNCYLSTSAQIISLDGSPIGTLRTKFEVYFLDGHGPYIGVGHHDFPGLSAAVRVDQNQSIYIASEAKDVSRNKIVVDQMIKGKKAFGQYHTWPKSGGNYLSADLNGFAEGWIRLQKLLAGEKSPWEIFKQREQEL